MAATSTLHFDLSHVDPEHDYKLKAFGVDYQLVRHTPESLAAAQLDNAALKHVPLERTTHYAANVGLEDDKVHLLRVKGPKVKTKEGFDIESLVLLSLYVPASALQSARAKRQTGPSVPPKLQAYGVSAIPLEGADDIDNGLAQHISPHDTAAALVGFHHELTALDPGPASTIQPHLSGASGLSMLADNIGGADPWNTPRVIMSDEPGKPLTDPKGNIVYQYELSDTTTNLLREPVRTALRTSKNDGDLKNLCWHHLDGKSSMSGTGGAPTVLRSAPGSDSRYGYALTQVSTQWGLNGELTAHSEAPDGFTVTVQLTNTFTRFLSVYVQFIGANGTPLTPTHWDSQLPMGIGSSIFENETTKYLGVERNRDTIMGVPCPSPEVNWVFTIPKDQTVTKARVLAGGLGRWWLNSADDRIAAWIGLGTTAVLNFGFPTFFLVQGIGVASSTEFNLLYNNKAFLLKTAYAIYQVASELIDNEGNTGDALKSLLQALSDTFLKTILYDAVVMAYWIPFATVEEAAELTPFVGVALKVALCVATGAEILQSTLECIASPMVYQFDLVVTIKNLNITVNPDPKHATSFPDSAKTYTITQRYSQNSAVVTTHDLADPGVSALNVQFNDVPAGGLVEILVVFSSKEGWVVGHGTSGLVVNQVPDGGSALEIQVTITEDLYPLNEQTTYKHLQKLTYQNGAHQWVKTSEAPTATVTSLNPEPGGNHLSQVNAIRLCEDTGVLAYSWCASGQGIPPIGRSDDPNVQLHSFQNIATSDVPDHALMFTPAGFSSAPVIATLRASRAETPVASSAPVNGAGATQFFVDPRGDGERGFHLRKVTQVVDPKTPADDPARNFQLDGSLSWGRFAAMPDDVDIHPNGYAVAVSAANHKLHLLRLSTVGVVDDQAPWAQDVSGQGDRPGLVDQPALICVTTDHRTLVLENGSNRIQAFDLGGNPVSWFTDFPDNPTWMPLWADASDPKKIEYLAIATEVEGYIYVLSYEGDGDQSADYRLDIYAPRGRHLCRTRGVAAASMSVDLWRNLFAVNYEIIQGKGGKTEASVSQWIPDTPASKA